MAAFTSSALAGLGALGGAGKALGAAGAIGGALAGGQRDQTTQRSMVPEATERERELQRMAFENYLAQQGLAQQGESQLAQYDPLRQMALQGYEDVLGGQALQATPEELAQIDQIRQAQINLGTQDIERLLGERIGQVSQSAGVRGLRGQALAQLQGQGVEAAAQQIGNVVNQAGLQAAQSAQQMPFQRLQAQSPFLQQGLTLQDQLRQQAIANRQALQSPALQQSLLNERLAGTTTTQTRPGGGLTGAIGGALGGFGEGALLGERLGALGRTGKDPMGGK